MSEAGREEPAADRLAVELTKDLAAATELMAIYEEHSSIEISEHVRLHEPAGVTSQEA